MKPLHQIIRKPLITEKASLQKEVGNTVAFEVSLNANKIEIKKAVEEAFKVTVKSVNVLNMRGKVKRMGRNLGRRRHWKKAVVTLQEGSTIEFFEGV